MKIYIVSTADDYRFFSTKTEAISCAKEDYHLALKEGRDYWWAADVWCFECRSILMQLRLMALLKDFFGSLSQELTEEEREALDNCLTEIPIAHDRIIENGTIGIRSMKKGTK